MSPILHLPRDAALTLDAANPHAAVRDVTMDGWPLPDVDDGHGALSPGHGGLSPGRASSVAAAPLALGVRGCAGYRAGRGALRLGHSGF